MSDDIGPGDVVEATRDVEPSAIEPRVAKGARATIRAIGAAEPSPCCDDRGPGLVLVEYPLMLGYSWCPCGWRKVGGSQADTIRRFAEDLNVRAPTRQKEDA